MAPPEPPAAITLKVRVPPGHIEGGSDEFTVGSLPTSTTIGGVRRQIQQLVPTHPPPERQRLLYAGHALTDDDQSLTDALNTRRDPTQHGYVVHLLIKGNGTSDAPNPPRQSTSTPDPRLAQPVHNGSGFHLPAAPQLPPHLQQEHARIHQQNMARHMQMHQQAVMQQMAQATGPGPAMILPFHPPSMPIPQIAGQPQNPMLHGGPQRMFGQAAAQGPQQQAATGLPGVGGQPDGTQRAPSPAHPTEQMQQQGMAQTASQGERTAQPPGSGQAQAPLNPPSQLNQTHQHPMPGRPISGQGFHFEGIGPNGQRVQIHQQTLQVPVMGGFQAFPAGMPQLMPQIPIGVPPFAPSNGLPLQPRRDTNGPSALDRACENMAAMRRLLNELRNDAGATEEQRRIVTDVQERAHALNSYIDPFAQHAGMQHARNTQGGAPTTFTASANPGNQQQDLHRNFTGLPPPPIRFPVPPTATNVPSPFANSASSQISNPSAVTCYLLSSPQGPHAIVFTPQHGWYSGHNLQRVNQPTPTPTTQPSNVSQSAQAQQAGGAHGSGLPDARLARNQPPAAAQNGQQQPQQQQQQQQQQLQQPPPDPLGPLQPLLAHLWLLLRVLIFAYFFLGANMGWRRPLALLAIGLGFWLIQLGLLGDGGALRRWWEGIVRVDDAAGREAQRQGGAEEAPPPPRDQQNAEARQPGRRRMPTPGEVAARLLNQQREGQAPQGQNAPPALQRLREAVRPVERAVALFVASLLPGVGEAHVRALQEQEERRRNEEEVRRRRREEEEKQKAKEEEVQESKGEATAAVVSEGSGGKANGQSGVADGSSSASA